MSKVPSPLLGYNNNVRHKNRIFHIQTEDSGVKYGHIITHLFMDGGRILKSVKTSYAEYLGNDKMAEIVREMMKQQHKTMFMSLRDGKFDHLVDGGADVSAQTKALSAEAAKKVVGAAPASPAAPPAAVAPPAAESAPAVDTKIGPMSVGTPAQSFSPTVPSLAAATNANASPPAPKTVLGAPAPPPHVAPTMSLTPKPGSVAAAPTTAANALAAAAAASPRSISPTGMNAVPAVLRGNAPMPPRRSTPLPPMRPATPSTLNIADQEEAAPSTERTPQELTLDIDALERAAAAAETASPMIRPASELPPPPANLFREKTATGSYRTLPPGPPNPGGSAPPPARESNKPPPARPPSNRPRPGDKPTEKAAAAGAARGRYGNTRPASIFGQSRPQQGKTIFGEDLISDKSLDEVILSYLADDLEPPAKK